MFDPREQGLRSFRQLLAIIRADPSYCKAVRQAFGSAANSISVTHVAIAIASFERTLVAGDSPFDRYFYGHQPHAISAVAIRGLKLFHGRTGCSRCHTITSRCALFTDNRFHNEGVGMNRIAARLAVLSTRVSRTPVGKLDDLVTSDRGVAALGRFVVARIPRDIRRYRTPTLRKVALSGPHMHDGSIRTLRQAVNFETYYRSLRSNRPLILTPQERVDLVAILDSLTSPEAIAFGKGSRLKAE